MTIKELADRLGVSSQSVYKRLKNHGVKLETLKDKATGEITAEGLQVVARVFNMDLTSEQTQPETATETETMVESPVDSEVERLKKEVERLTTEVEKLNNLNSTIVEKVQTLESERDYLRNALQAQQQLQAMTLQRLPALPAAGQTSRAGGLFGWLNRRKKSKGGSENDGNEGI